MAGESIREQKGREKIGEVRRGERHITSTCMAVCAAPNMIWQEKKKRKVGVVCAWREKLEPDSNVINVREWELNE